MVDEIKSVPRLPIFGNKDRDQIADRYGNRYEYNAERDEWIYLGQISTPSTVTESSDGLVSPSIQRKLEHIKRLQASGFNFNLFKLFTRLDKDPYFFLFQSSDYLLTFSPEIVKNDLILLAQDAITGVEHSANTTTIMTTSRLTGQLAGMSVTFITGTLRRETFIVAENTTTSFTLSGILDANIGDIFRIYEPEDITQKLRIEINRDRLFRLLTGKCCIGPKGKKGQKGQAGLDGSPAANEIFGSPVVVGSDTIIVNVVVQSPIDTPISLRIFDDGIVIVEVLAALDGSGADITIIGDDIEIDETASSIVYDATSNLLQAEIKFIAGADNINEWQFKARQRGPKGATGKDGSSFFQITEQTISDPAIRSADAIVSIRKSDIDDSLFSTQDAMFSTVCASNLRPASTEFPISENIDEVSLLAVEVSTRNCKDIGNFIFKPAISTPTLALPLWTPTKDCVDPRRYFQYKFDWYTDLEERYPFRIFQNPIPEPSCCADDFFFCGNLGDICEIKGQPSAPPFFSPKSVCKCIGPAEFDLQGNGFLLDPLNESGSTAVNGVLTNSPDHYMQELIVTGTVYSIEITATDLCTGDEFEVADCPINVTVVITGDCVIDNPIQTINSTLPLSLEFNITSSETGCELMADIVVNTEGADCCTGYLITTTLTPPPGIVTLGTGGSDVGSDPSSPDEDISGTDEGGSNPPSAARLGKQKKFIAGVPIGAPLGVAAAPPPPTAPPPSGTSGIQIIISISSVSIDLNRNATISGQNFTINGISVISSILFGSTQQSVFTVTSSSTIITTVPSTVLAGPSQIQLILTVPPGLSNIVIGQVPADAVVEPEPEPEPEPIISPSDFPGLTLWLDAQVAGTLFENNTFTTPATPGGPVGGWIDMSGTISGVTSAGAARPILNPSIINGHPAVDFDGADDTLTQASGTMGTIFTASAYELFAVIYIDAIDTDSATITANDRIFGNSGGTSQIAGYLRGSTGFNAYNNDGVGDSVSRPIGTGAVALIHQRHEGGLLVASVNAGTEISTGSGATAGLAATLVLGGLTSQFYNGFIGEFIVYNTNLSTAQRAQMYTYLFDHWS